MPGSVSRFERVRATFMKVGLGDRRGVERLDFKFIEQIFEKIEPSRIVWRISCGGPRSRFNGFEPPLINVFGGRSPLVSNLWH